MTQKDILKRILLAVVWMSVLLMAEGVQAQEEFPENVQREINPETEQWMKEYLEELDLQNLQESLTELFPEKSLNFREMLQKVAAGEIPFSLDTLIGLAADALLSEVRTQKKNVVQILILAIAASFFANFMRAFDRGQVQEIAFYMVYLLLFALLLNGFKELSSFSENTIGRMLQFMRLLLPVYLLAGSLAAQPVTSLGFYEVTLFLLTLLQSLIRYILFPGIGCYVLIAMLNNLAKEEYLSKLMELLQKGISWALKTVAAAAVGVQTVQRILLPALDHLKSSVWMRAGGALPVIGNTLRGVTETVFGTAAVLKNAVGVCGLLIVGLLMLTPVLRLLFCLFLYRMVSAAVQPLSDVRFTGCISRMADGVSLLLSCITVTGVLFLLSIAIVTTA